METLNALNFLSNGLRNISNWFYTAAQENMAVFTQNKQNSIVDTSDNENVTEQDNDADVSDIQNGGNTNKQDDIVSVNDHQINKFAENNEENGDLGECDIQKNEDVVNHQNGSDATYDDIKNDEIDMDEKEKCDLELHDNQDSRFAVYAPQNVDLDVYDINVNQDGGYDVGEQQCAGFEMHDNQDDRFAVVEQQDADLELHISDNEDCRVAVNEQQDIDVAVHDNQDGRLAVDEQENCDGEINDIPTGGNDVDDQDRRVDRNEHLNSILDMNVHHNDRNTVNENHRIIVNIDQDVGIPGNKAHHSEDQLNPCQDGSKTPSDKSSAAGNNYQTDLSSIYQEMDTNIEDRIAESDFAIDNKFDEDYEGNEMFYTEITHKTVEQDKIASITENFKRKLQKIQEDAVRKSLSKVKCSKEKAATEAEFNLDIQDEAETLSDQLSEETDESECNNDVIKCINITGVNCASEVKCIEVIDLDDTNDTKGELEITSCLNQQSMDTLVNAEVKDTVIKTNYLCTEPDSKFGYEDTYGIKYSEWTENSEKTEVLDDLYKDELNIGQDEPYGSMCVGKLEEMDFASHRNQIPVFEEEFTVGGKRSKTMKTVESRYKYKCECGMQFERRNSLILHKKSCGNVGKSYEQEVKTFVCEICFRSFKKKGFLDRHFRLKH